MSKAAPTIDHREPGRGPGPTPELIADRYRIRRLLGTGGMGEVLLADDEVLARPVAIKRSRAPERDGRHGCKLRREARIAARVAHRAVVRVYDLVRDAGVDHLVMELVDGPSLFELHAAGPLAPADVVRIALELASALDSVHRRGAVHLDVKLENVLLTRDGQPKLGDFGIARFAHEDDSELLHLVGTPRVMSPEQIEGRAVDARSDLYSLGVLLFELLAGTSPFAGAGEQNTLSRVLGESAPRLDALAAGVPAPLTQLVADLLEKSPARRPQTAFELEVRLASVAEALA
jgi:serine/threonine-protein kinase